MTLPVLANDPGQIEQAADPAGYVILACERAKTWLTQALEHGQIEDIIELKSQAEAIRVYTAQKQIGKDAELAAAEIVRRAERGIGVAIRRGQESGEIRAYGQSAGPQQDYERGGKTVRVAPALHEEKRISPSQFFHGGQDMTDSYAVADLATDEQFDEVLAEARTEGNLTRRNVVSKVRARAASSGVGLSSRQGRAERVAELAAKNYSSRQIAETMGLHFDTIRVFVREFNIKVPADAVVGKSRRHDSNRIVEQTVHALDGLRMGVELIDFTALDPAKIPGWSSSLSASLRSLNQLARRLKELN